MRAAIPDPALPILNSPGFPGGSLEIRHARRLTEAEFDQFCTDNPDLRIEQDKNGTLIIMPPLDTDSGLYEDEVHGMLYAWRTQHSAGRSFSPSVGFRLPDGSLRSADSAWVSEEKLAALPKSERKKFAHLVPDFVIKVRSETDRLNRLKRKMTDAWIKNGVRLAWLLDPKTETVYIYRADGSSEELKGFDRVLTGEDVCVGLEMDLRRLRL